MNVTAPLAEIFSSFQGEGPDVGRRHLFVRFRGCELTCKYCDTAAARSTAGDCRVEREPASDRWEMLPNPLTVGQVVAAIDALAAQAPPNALAITGGEPLLHPQFLSELLPELKSRGYDTYLDTACCYPDAMVAVAPWLDCVSADLKLPSTMAEPIAFSDFAACLKAIMHQYYVKIVITSDVTVAELDESLRRLHELDQYATVILQPVTPTRQVQAATAKHLFALAAACDKYFPARLIPQCHPLMGIK
ncbi:MAG: 7-carboxy-7-deazaguanine synthase QueE [Armatimonadota bacterium]